MNAPAPILKIFEYLKSIAEELDQTNQQKNLLLIPRKHVEQMESFLSDLPATVDSHELLRKAIAKALKLDKRDSVFFMNGKIVIRFFKRTDTERRFEGLPAEEVKKIVDGIYSKKDAPDMAGDLDMVISTIADTELNFAEIDNLFFNTRHIKIIQEGLVRFYKTKLPGEETVVQAVANYIFRESFYYVHELLAEKLLELIEYKDKNAETFLRYYNGSTLIQNGKKLITPEIVDEEGQKWKIAAIVNFISQFAKNRTLITKKENSIRTNQWEEKEVAGRIAESARLVETLSSKKPPPDINEKMLLQLEKNRQLLDKNRTGHSDQALNNLSPQEIYEEFQKCFKDLNKRVDFLHMRTEGDQKAIDEVKGTFDVQLKKYDMLVIAISEVLMDRKTPAAIKE